MRDVAKQNNLAFNKDVKQLTVGTAKDFYKYVQNNQNQTWYGIVWCTSEWDVYVNNSLPPVANVPCKFRPDGENGDKRMMFYSIFYNNSLEESVFISGFHKPTPRDGYLIQLKVSVDNAILRYLSKERGISTDQTPQIDMTHSFYPIVSSRIIQNMNLVAQVGAYFFILTPLLTFTVFLNEIVREKEMRLR